MGVPPTVFLARRRYAVAGIIRRASPAGKEDGGPEAHPTEGDGARAPRPLLDELVCTPLLPMAKYDAGRVLDVASPRKLLAA